MKNFNLKIFYLFSILLFSTYAMGNTPHFIWDNQDGVVRMENCSIAKVKKHDLRLSMSSGYASKSIKNFISGYSGLFQSNLANFSMIKLTSQHVRSNNSLVEVVGINDHNLARSNRWLPERGDNGYLRNTMLQSLDDFVFELDLTKKELGNAFDKELVKSSSLDFDLDQKLYLKIAADTSYYGMSCEGAEKRNYMLFRAYQKDHSNGPLFYMGVSSEETSIFKSFTAIGRDAAMKFLADVGHESPLIEGDIQDEVVTVTTPNNKDETISTEDLPLPAPRPVKIVPSQSLQKVACIASGHLNIRDKSLSHILFRAQVGEQVKVFQNWDGTEVKRVINGVEHTFRKVTFINREAKDQNTGYVAATFIKTEDDCPYLNKPKEKNQLEETSKITGINDTHCCDFPTVKRPTHDWTKGVRKFGVNRGGGRKHAACDLYRYKDEPIKSVAPGKVVSNLYYFYQGTYAIEVRHSGGFIVRYGELTGYKAAGVKVNARIKMGQKLGKMGKVNSNCCRPMLHFELYSGKGKGSLTKRSSKANPFRRRSDLMDPTAYLEKWANGVF